MSHYEKGILGAFSGKVGTVVGATWRGENIMRSTPRKSTKPATLKQETQRLRFAIIAHFLRYIRPVIELYYGEPQGKKSRRNLAISYHMKEALVGDYPDFAIDYNKVVLALGPQNPEAIAEADTKVAITWQDNSNLNPQAMEKASDQLLVVAYNPTLNRYETRSNAAKRDTLVYNLELPSNWAGETVPIWIAFVSEDGTLNSSSYFLGAFVLA